MNDAETSTSKVEPDRKELKKPAPRPSMTFKSITFSDGKTITLAPDDIIVFVGPNNAGKSAALKELEIFVGRSIPGQVIKSTELDIHGTYKELNDYLEENAQVVGDPPNKTYAGLGYSIHHTHVQFLDLSDNRHTVAPFFFSRLATEVRITSSNAAPALALFQQPPTHPIHLLLMDDKLAEKQSALFKRAFGRDLFPFRAGGSSFPLFVGQKPEIKHGENELSRSYVTKIRERAQLLEQQGDGMRSFATVLLYALAAENQSIQFLDEPEAFLHPPQARLIGQYIANERSGKSQLFISTHSADVLNGLLDGKSKVRIIRIQRDGNVNKIKELDAAGTAEAAKDTMVRYSGVFSGIFYQHVVICESDADCMFYRAILETNAVTGAQSPDVLFIQAGGKHRLAKLAQILKSLAVPISVIADADVLNDRGVLCNLYEMLGGVWSDIENNWNALREAVEARRPPFSARDIKAQITAKLDTVGSEKVFPRKTEGEIKTIFSSASPWSEVKRSGRLGIPHGHATVHFDRLLEKCGENGLWIVPVGELEGFCRSSGGGHGPGFVHQVLQERDLESDPELQPAREFMARLWRRQAAKVSM